MRSIKKVVALLLTAILCTGMLPLGTLADIVENERDKSITITVGEELNLAETEHPDWLNLDDKLKAVGEWTSDDEDVAVVDGNGILTAVGKGSTTVTYTVSINSNKSSVIESYADEPIEDEAKDVYETEIEAEDESIKRTGEESIDEAEAESNSDFTDKSADKSANKSALDLDSIDSVNNPYEIENDTELNENISVNDSIETDSDLNDSDESSNEAEIEAETETADDNGIDIDEDSFDTDIESADGQDDYSIGEDTEEVVLEVENDTAETITVEWKVTVKEEVPFETVGEPVIMLLTDTENGRIGAEYDMVKVELDSSIIPANSFVTFQQVKIDSYILAYDITFTASDGVKWEPNVENGETVDVTFSIPDETLKEFSGVETKEGESADVLLEVHHLETEADIESPEIVATETVTVGDGVSVEITAEAESFSVYGLTGTAYANTTVSSLDELKNQLDDDGKLKSDITITTCFGITENLTIDLNGYTITDGCEGTVFIVKAGSTVTIKGDGTIQGLSSGSAALIVVHGTLNLEGGTLTGHKNTGSGEGGAVYVDGTFNMSGGTISSCSSKKGGGVYVLSSGTFNMSGGTITGCTSSDDGGGVYVEYGTFNMSGGEITGCTSGTLADEMSSASSVCYGGGVYANGSSKESKATFTMTGGSINNCKADAGGGIYAGEYCNFYLYGGDVSNNQATAKRLASTTEGEPNYNGGLDAGGGGIWINGTAVIDPTHEGGSNISITGNTSATEVDLGGGGIYVNNSATLDVRNAIITGNHAEGLGGGIASCVHGRVSVLNVDQYGTAIYSNTASGTAYDKNSKVSSGGYIVGEFVDGQKSWLDQDDDDDATKAAKKAFRDAAKDIFCAGDDNYDGGTIIISCQDSDGVSADWYGYVMDNSDSEFEKINTANNGYIYGGYLLGLTSGNTSGQVTLDRTVTISGNSSDAHGGGIACNGILTVTYAEKAASQTITSYALDGAEDLTFTKKVVGDKFTLEDGDFTFILSEEPDGDGVEAVNDADGNIVLNYGSLIDQSSALSSEYVYYVREVSSGNPDMTYDSTVYRVTVKIAEGELETSKVYISQDKTESITLVIHHYSVESVAIERGMVSGENVWTADSVSAVEGTPTFTNSYERGTTSLTVNKQWTEDGTSNNFTENTKLKVTVKLLQNGEEPTDIPDNIETTLTLNNTNNWTAEWSSLYAYDEYGNQYTYTVEETGIETTDSGMKIGDREIGTIAFDEADSNFIRVYGTTIGQDGNYEILGGWIVSEGETATNSDGTLYTTITNKWLPAVNEGNTKLVIKKIDATSKEPIPNVTFTLNDGDSTDGNTQTVTTGEDGTAEFTDLAENHTYTLTETSTPTGYISSNAEWIIEVLPDYTTLVKAEKEYGETAGTNTWQYKASVETEVDGEVQSQTIEYGGTLIIENTRELGSIQITKVFDLDTDTLLTENDTEKEFSFQLLGKDGNIVQTVTAVRNGIAEFTDLEWGTYTIQEITTDTGLNYYDWQGVEFTCTGDSAAPMVLYDEDNESSTATVTIGAESLSASFTATNSYTVKDSAVREMPETGGSGRFTFTVCGLSLISAAVVYGCYLKRKKERESC